MWKCVWVCVGVFERESVNGSVPVVVGICLYVSVCVLVTMSICLNVWECVFACMQVCLYVCLCMRACT